jgi:hypothetical protein
MKERTGLRIITLIIASVAALTVTAWSTNRTRLAESKIRPKQHGAVVGQKKVVDEGIHYPDQPLEITELRIDGKEAKLSKGVTIDTEWLRGLSWKVKNVTDKNILAIDLFIVFPQTASNGGRLFVLSMKYGTDPKSLGRPDTSQPLRPKDTTTFVISDEIYGRLKPNLEKQVAISDVNHLRIKTELVVFDDDTAWGGGQHMRRDPNNPRVWVPVD